MLDIFLNKKTKDVQNQLEIVQATLNSVNQKLDKKIFELSILHRASESIVSLAQLPDLLKSYLDIFTEATHAKCGCVLLEESEEFLAKECRNINEEAVRSARISTHAGLVKTLRETRHICKREDLSKKSELLASDEIINMRRLNAELIIPLLYGQDLLGMVTLGEIHDKEAFSDDNMRLLDAVAWQMSAALFSQGSAGRIESLKQKVNKKDFDLVNMRRISKAFSSLLDTAKLKEFTLNLIFETIDVQKAILFLRDEDEIVLVSAASAGIPAVSDKPIDFEIDNSFIKKLLNNKKPYFMEVSHIKEALDYHKCNPYTAAVLIESALSWYVPLISNERMVGLLALGPKRCGEGFTSSELELLDIFSFQLAVIIENAKLFESVVLDGLTKTYIHRFFQQRLEYETKIGIRYRTKRILCLAMLDVDHFKNINDTYGHQAGDKILYEIAKIILNNVRTTDIVARYGGEEFAIIMPEVDLKEGGIISERIRQAIHNNIFLPQELSLKVTVSFGVATYPDYAQSKEELISMADKALYKSKEEGRNKVTLCGD